MAKKYLMGLDLGTDSVGWCVTDENNKIIKKGGKSLWGARLFDEAQDCKSRRINREARRRTQRRRERIDLLQLLFKEEIDKVDKNFFLRLNESFYKPEDKSEEIKDDNNYLFVDKGFTDKDYKKKYPTIYHLRKALCDTKDKADIRLIYLAVAHMIKYRGNFLYDVSEFKPSDIERVRILLKNINETFVNMGAESQLNLEGDYANEFNNKVLTARGISGKKEALAELFGKDKYLTNVVYPLMAGGKVATKKIFEPEEDIEIDPKDFTFSSEAADEALEKLSEQFPNDLHVELLNSIRGIYDYLLIGKLLGDSTSISEAMVKRYEEHKKDLKILKKYVKEHLTKEDYDDIFRKKGDDDKNANYVMYVGSSNSSFEKIRCPHCSRDAFYKYIKIKLGLDKIKKASDITDETLKDIYQKIEDKTYLARQNSTDNGVFPYQLNKSELLKILNNQAQYYPFLNAKDENGTTIDKIVSLLTFKIPYYVGPLLAPYKNNPNQRTSHSWVVRYSNEKIYPWNFDKIVNKDESAAEFIKRMLNKCTYFPDCYCLPLNSLLFQRYQTLSLLNKTMINGQLMSREDKEGIIENLFKKQMSVSKKGILEFFKSKYGEDVSVTTSTGKELEEVNASMSSYCFFSNKLGEDFVDNNVDKIEGIIRDLTVFEDSKIIERRLKTIYGLTPEQIKKIKDKRLTGWGRLSRELLEMTSQSNNEYGEVITVKLIDVMENTNFNLMELINSDKYDFKKKIEEANKKTDYNFASRKEKHQAIVDFVDDCYVSPGMKRPLIQAMAIIEDVEKIINHPIDEFYVECTRSNKAEKKAKDSRQKDLIKKYAEAAKRLAMSAMIKESFDRSYKELKEETDLGRFRSDKFYLYLTQMGKCAYTLKDIDLAELFSDDSAYDIDHIIPQALVKDDSIENRVLVCSNVNREKTSTYPIPSSLKAPGANAFYKILLKAGLIGEKKYSNLTRTTELSDDELLSFVNRQLVYTNQAVKALVDVIKTFEKDSNGNPPKVVYSKAENVSDFRRDYGIIKVRDANHFHHAHDAYLNICIGRAIDTYFGDVKQRIYDQYRNGRKSLNVKKIFIDNDGKNKKPLLDKDGNIVWDYQKSISEIKNNIFNRYDILTTTMQYIKGGQLTKATIYPASDDKDGSLLPVKGSGPVADASKYGGKSDISYGFYTLVEHKVKNKTLVTVVPIPLLYSDGTNEERTLNYLTKVAGLNVTKILIPVMRINSILKLGSSKACITGKSGSRFILRNLSEIYFSSADLHTIKMVSKLSEKFRNERLSMMGDDDGSISSLFAYDKNEFVISPASNSKATPIVIKNDELRNLYSSIVKKYESNAIVLMSASKNAGMFLNQDSTKEKFEQLEIWKKSFVLLQMLQFLTLATSSPDFSLVGGSKCMDRTKISANLSSSVSIVVESPTGYYTKTLWKGQQ